MRELLVLPRLPVLGVLELRVLRVLLAAKGEILPVLREERVEGQGLLALAVQLRHWQQRRDVFALFPQSYCGGLRRHIRPLGVMGEMGGQEARAQEEEEPISST